MIQTRADAWALVTEFVQSDSLRKHMLAVEASMRYYAELLGEDVDYWGIVGLIHDFDYEKYPGVELHVWTGSKILAERGWPAELIRTVQSHADYMGVPREKLVDHALFACDELSGFVTAVAYVRPSHSLAEVEPRSVLKKMKDKAFARAVSREDMVQGAAELGLPLEEHVANVIAALQRIAPELGL
ncbi:MAG: HDIG domain-containing metalloprotein [Chloroflexia bacterium]